MSLPAERRSAMLDHAACSRAVVSRDPRFDGVFFVGISTTRIYCRPVCPARVSYPERRRFFDSAAAAERQGYRPCLRCRPELAPGRALCDAVPRVARAAAMRIAAGALNGRGVGDLARELGVSERHLRRAMEREMGVSPIELAQTHRLLLAKCLLTDTRLPVTRVAFASGFQSLRRFNSVFRERYRMSPSVLRHRPRPGRDDVPAGPAGDWVRLSLAYRPPLAWAPLLATIAVDTPPGVGMVDGHRYARTVALDGCRGLIMLEPPAGGQLSVHVSVSLLPALMPLLARLRHLLDLDAEPAMIDAQLAEGGLSALVARRPGLRMPGAFEGFEVAAREILLPEFLRQVTRALGEPIATGISGLDRLALSADRVAQAGVASLSTLGVPRRQAVAVATVARAVTDGNPRLEPGAELRATLRALAAIPGLHSRAAAAIATRAVRWPDAFPSTDVSLQRAAGVPGARALLRLAERWRPWRGYAALHLSLQAAAGSPGHRRIAETGNDPRRSA
ncbi:MAG TPA: AlkA N-terminal domain-containing protein [Gemmatimonadales bacterium]|nr:AlkA N-terminal domain-containing protein [Gemmatimonadales bacterium]